VYNICYLIFNKVILANAPYSVAYKILMLWAKEIYYGFVILNFNKQICLVYKM